MRGERGRRKFCLKSLEGISAFYLCIVQMGGGGGVDCFLARFLLEIWNPANSIIYQRGTHCTHTQYSIVTIPPFWDTFSHKHCLLKKHKRQEKQCIHNVCSCKICYERDCVLRWILLLVTSMESQGSGRFWLIMLTAWIWSVFLCFLLVSIVWEISDIRHKT